MKEGNAGGWLLAVGKWGILSVSLRLSVKQILPKVAINPYDSVYKVPVNNVLQQRIKRNG